MTRKGEAITLSVQKRQRDCLESLAAELQMLWGGKPSISQLVKAIADNKLRVAANHDWSIERIANLYQAWQSLKDAGQLDAALGLAVLLLERHETALPIRQALEDFLEKPGKPWRSALDALIRKHQPFELAYQDASGRISNFTVRHAKIITYERREYLDCYCEETEGNKDLPTLAHNWCFRLERIPDETSLSPIASPWIESLPTLEVEIHLLNHLAFSYESKPTDLMNEWHESLPKARRVVRAVSNTFWFLREVRRYGADCLIVGPEAVRSRFIAEQRILLQQYSEPMEEALD
jgi:predicted DNA-binding transcriptional regulator YafY